MALSRVLIAHDLLDSEVITGNDAVALFDDYVSLGVLATTQPVNDDQPGTAPTWIT